MTAITRSISSWAPIAPLRPRSVIAGAIGAAGLLLAYLGIITLAQGADHAVEQLAADAVFVGLIILGFGAQVALFVELREVDRDHRAAAGVMAAGTGTSAAAMLACCAHHLVDLLPLVGLSAAAVFLNAYKTPLFVVALGMNLLGIIVIGRRLQAARSECAAANADPSIS